MNWIKFTDRMPPIRERILVCSRYDLGDGASEMTYSTGELTGDGEYVQISDTSYVLLEKLYKWAAIEPPEID